nr:hypothetical protein Iba_scaffold1675382CG0010 [Ipomoea batatas]
MGVCSSVFSYQHQWMVLVSLAAIYSFIDNTGGGSKTTDDHNKFGNENSRKWRCSEGSTSG